MQEITYLSKYADYSTNNERRRKKTKNFKIKPRKTKQDKVVLKTKRNKINQDYPNKSMRYNEKYNIFLINCVLFKFKKSY